MKLKTIAKASAALSLAAVLFPTAASAATTSTGTTQGDVTFTEKTPDFLDMVKPGTYDTLIDGVDGNNGSPATLQINWVPNLHFGDVTKKVTDQSVPVQIGKYKERAGSTNINIPQFVQVQDSRGTNGSFKLTAKATLFTDGSDTLTNTRVQFYGYKLTNTLKDKVAADADATSLLEGIPTSSIATGAMAELDPTNDLLIMQTNGTESATGSISSLVFDDTYTSSKDYSAATHNDKVKLFVPAGEGQVGNQYTSTITWTLSDTK